MYLLFGIFLMICVLFLLVQLFRRRRIIRKVRCMDFCNKICLLQKVLHPFGFAYQTQGDIITTTLDAWQRRFGYCALYDNTAVHFHMVFDCEPIYFYYRERTYLIELWKGQYGITVGGEVGVYYTDGMIPPDQFAVAHFESVTNQELLSVKIDFYYRGHRLFTCSNRHWWLAGFCLGRYCEPENVTMRVSITCSDQEMLLRFVESMVNLGYAASELSVCELNVSFLYAYPHGKQPRCVHRFAAACSQWKNRIFSRLFRWITMPFTRNLDRLVYLYFFLPHIFRRLLIRKRCRKQKFRRKSRGGVRR